VRGRTGVESWRVEDVEGLEGEVERYSTPGNGPDGPLNDRSFEGGSAKVGGVEGEVTVGEGEGAKPWRVEGWVGMEGAFVWCLARVS